MKNLISLQASPADSQEVSPTDRRNHGNRYILQQLLLIEAYFHGFDAGLQSDDESPDDLSSDRNSDINMDDLTEVQQAIIHVMLAETVIENVYVDPSYESIGTEFADEQSETAGHVELVPEHSASRPTEIVPDASASPTTEQDEDKPDATDLSLEVHTDQTETVVFPEHFHQIVQRIQWKLIQITYHRN